MKLLIFPERDLSNLASVSMPIMFALPRMPPHLPWACLYSASPSSCCTRPGKVQCSHRVWWACVKTGNLTVFRKDALLLLFLLFHYKLCLLYLHLLSIQFVIGCFLHAALRGGTSLHWRSLVIDFKVCKSDGSQVNLQITPATEFTSLNTSVPCARKVSAVTEL